MSIQQEADSFSGRNYRAPTCTLHKLGNGWNRNVFPTGEFISLFDYWLQLDVNRVVRIDVGAIDMVCDDPVFAGINASNKRRSVYHGCAGIHGMVIAKSDSLTRELPKRRGILFANEIRPHPVPDDHNDVARLIR
jgi:hypothetical protein